MLKSKTDIIEELIDLLAGALSSGWVKPSLIKRLYINLKNKKTPTRFLTLSPEQLINKYNKENLLSFQIGNYCFNLPQSVIYDNTKNKLSLENFKLEIDKNNSEYHLPQEIKSKASQLKKIQKKIQKKYYYDSTTIRLNDIKISSDTIKLLVSKAHYSDYLATNFSMDAKLKGWRISLRQQVHPTSNLCELNKSLLANHLGVGVILFTSDNFLILPVRSPKRVNIFKNEISPSISGACNFDRDIIKGLSELLNPILREGSEELNIETNDIYLTNIKLLGITRELLRGGKPESFYYGKLKCSKDEIIAKHKETQDKEYSKIKFFEFKSALLSSKSKEELPFYYDSIFNDFRGLLKEFNANLSLPILTNLIFWVKYKIS